VRSAPGEGSTFSFTLPLFGAAARPVRRSSWWLPRRRDAPRGPPRGRGARLLRPRGRGRRGGRGVGRAPAAAVVVLDRILPRLGPGEVAERLRAQPATRAVPLVLLGSGEDLGPRSSLFRECLSRPVDRRMLAATLERLGRRLTEVLNLRECSKRPCGPRRGRARRARDRGGDRGSTPQKAGARMLVYADGRIVGTIGGGASKRR